ncbi:MAG: GrlR family regulatory protein [Pseudomonadota bacterium]
MDGIWTGEVLGLYGWENSGVYVLEDGRIIGGSSRHYSTGTYTVNDGQYEADVSVHYYGPPRAIFGETKEQFSIRVKGTVSEGVLDAEISRSDKPKLIVEYRMTRRMDLP